MDHLLYAEGWVFYAGLFFASFWITAGAALALGIVTNIITPRKKVDYTYDNKDKKNAL